MKSYFLNCVEWTIKNFYKIDSERNATVKFEVDGTSFNGYLYLRSQKSSGNVKTSRTQLELRIYRHNYDKSSKFYHSVVKFEAFFKDTKGKLDYDSKKVTPGKSWTCFFNYFENLGFDYDLLKLNETKHSKAGSVTFAIFVIIHARMDSEDAEINVYPNLYETDFLSDFTIICNERKFPVHRVVLCEISPVFLRMLQTEMKEAKTNEVVITDIEEEAIVEMIRFMYTGKANLTGSIAVKLLHVADKYEIEKMKMKCIEFLNLDLSTENVIETLVLADQFEAMDLRINSIEFIRVHFNELAKESNWAGVDGTIVIQIAKVLNKEIFVTDIISS